MSDIFGGPPDDEEYDPLGYPEDYPEVEDPYGFWGGEVPGDSWYDQVTIENDYGQEMTMTSGEWHALTMDDPDGVLERFQMDNIDLIWELDYYGYWSSEDWEIWREGYEEG